MQMLLCFRVAEEKMEIGIEAGFFPYSFFLSMRFFLEVVL